MKILSIYFFVIFNLFSCAGYHFNTNNNPLIGYDIKTVSVPMFVNRSVLPQVTAPMTKEIALALASYSGLKVYSGDNLDADAVLVGVIESKDHYNEVVKTTESLFTDSTTKIHDSIGGRAPFFYPVTSSFELALNIYLIKRPSKEELELLSSDLGKFVKANPKIVLTDRLIINGTFTRAVGDTTSTASGGEVNFTKNKGIMEKAIQDACKNTAISFKQTVLNAF